jgi:hypothetical protein
MFVLSYGSEAWIIAHNATTQIRIFNGSKFTRLDQQNSEVNREKYRILKLQTWFKITEIYVANVLKGLKKSRVHTEKDTRVL